MEIRALTLEEIEDIAQRAADKAVQRMKEKELLPKSEIMQRLNIKDNRTFQRRVKDYDVKPAGKIGKEDAYYISSFTKLAS